MTRIIRRGRRKGVKRDSKLYNLLVDNGYAVETICKMLKLHQGTYHEYFNYPSNMTIEQLLSISLMTHTHIRDIFNMAIEVNPSNVQYWHEDEYYNVDNSIRRMKTGMGVVEYNRGLVRYHLPDKALKWLGLGIRGVGVCTMFSVLSGLVIIEDFGFIDNLEEYKKVYDLIDHVPSWLKRLDNMRKVSTEWGKLVTDWNHCCLMYEKGNYEDLEVYLKQLNSFKTAYD